MEYCDICPIQWRTLCIAESQGAHFFSGCRQVQFDKETGNSDPRNSQSFPVNTDLRYAQVPFKELHRIFCTRRCFKYTLRTMTRFVFDVMLVKASFCTPSLLHVYGNVTKVRLSCAYVKLIFVRKIRMKSKFAKQHALLSVCCSPVIMEWRVFRWELSLPWSLCRFLMTSRQNGGSGE
jgi:hypothetical protein